MTGCALLDRCRIRHRRIFAGGFLEHRVTALRSPAGLLVAGDLQDASGQVLRIAERLELDPHTVTEAIAGVTRP